MFCNAFHSFSLLFERVPSHERSSGDVAPPHQVELEMAPEFCTLVCVRPCIYFIGQVRASVSVLNF